ncbi:MAG: SGNH/GDSL hydrolase family protein [bacterium]|nr:SGNH/GDSL hydrolase family protein [bacterium]
MLIEPHARVLFQGDSITDCDRNRNDDNNLGSGYPAMIAAWLSALYPCRNITFLNRGISGHRVKDLLARWKTDCLDLQPTWVSILIGINDVWRRYDCNDPTSLQDFVAGYRELLRQIRAATKAHIILCEPFLLPVHPTLDRWREDLDPKIGAVRALAREFHTYYVPLDGLFAAASARREPAFWAADGVHPTPAGHALIAQAWLRTIQAHFCLPAHPH